MRHGKCFLILAGLLIGSVAPPPATAEWFVDAYGGRSWTRPSDVEIKGVDVLGVPVRVELLDVTPEDSVLLGARVGYWFGFAPELDLAVDAFYFRPDVRAQRVTATAGVTGVIFDEPISVAVAGPARIPSAEVPAGVVSLDVMVRWRLLTTPDIPHGRLQPYLLVGPAFLITDPDDLGTSLGVKVGAGLAWQLHRRVALFAEYRFTHFTPEVESGRLRYEADVTTHHVLGGISFRF